MTTEGGGRLRREAGTSRGKCVSQEGGGCLRREVGISGRKVGHRLLVRKQMFKTHSQAPGALGRQDRGHGEMHTWESDEFRVRDDCASAFGTEAAPGCREGLTLHKRAWLSAPAHDPHSLGSIFSSQGISWNPTASISCPTFPIKTSTAFLFGYLLQDQMAQQEP